MACLNYFNSLFVKLMSYYQVFNGSAGLSLNIVFILKLDFRTIAYSVSKTRFFVGKPPFVPVSRELPITNTFGFTMIIYDAAFPAEVENVFSVSLRFC